MEPRAEDEIALAEIETNPSVWACESDGELHEIPVDSIDEADLDAYHRQLLRKRARSEEASPYTPSSLRRRFDILQAKYPQIDPASLCQQASRPQGLEAHVISQSDLDRTEDRVVKVVRSKPRRIGERTYTDSETVELASLCDEWKYLDGTVTQVLQRVFDGTALWVLTD